MKFTEEDDWMSQAACKDKDPDLFFSEDIRDQRRAKLVCHACSVRIDCLNYALKGGDTHGIFGGMTPNERWKLLSKQAKSSRQFGGR